MDERARPEMEETGPDGTRELPADGISGRIRRMLEMDVADIASLPALHRHATRLFRFIHRVIQRFVADRCIQRASALAYASLLAFVPLSVLGFSVFSGFEAFAGWAERVRDALLSYLVPTSREAILAYLGTVTEKTTALSVFGVLGLLVTATALLNTIEEAFNDIWRITRARPWLSKFVTFWATLTLAPLLIGASLTITSYFAALPVIRDVAEGAGAIGRIPFVLPWVMSSLALATMYVVLPNTSVPFRHALIGGLIAGALFELSKLGFAYYVTEVANYQRLYGALSTLPIFLIWLYLVWVIVLAGAEITFCLHHPEQSYRRHSFFLHPGIRQFFAHLILVKAAQALTRGDVLRLPQLCEELEVPDNILQEWMDELTREGLLRRTDDRGEQAWVLATAPDRLSLARIQERLNPGRMLVPGPWRNHPLGRTLMGLYYRIERSEQETLGAVTLEELAARSNGDESAAPAAPPIEPETQ